MAEAFKFVRNMDGTNAVPAITTVPVAATQTLVVGDVVALSSGKAAKAVGGGIGRVLGIMAEDSTSAAEGTMVRIYVVTPSQEWRGVASADASALTLGTRTYDLSSSLTVDVADTTGGCIQINRVGTSNTDVYVQFTACVYA